MPERKEIMMSTLVVRSSMRLAVFTLVIAGCGSSATPTVAPAIEQPASASAAPLASASPSASAAAEPSPIDPGTVEPELALERLWTGIDPAGADWVAHPVIDPQGRIWAGAFGGNEFLAFDRDGKHLETWDAGSETGPNGHFGGMAFGPDGRIYVADAAGRRVLVFDKDRKPVKEFGAFGTGPDQFVTPNAIVADAVGNVYVHDDETGAVKKFSPDGDFLIEYAHDTYPPVFADTNEHVYVVVGPGKILKELAPDGSVVRTIDLSGLVDFAIAIAVDDEGNIWLGSNSETPTGIEPDRIVQLGPDGILLHNWEGVPTDDFALDPQGDRIYTGWETLLAFALPAE